MRMSFKTSYFLLVVGFTVDLLIVSGVTLPPAVIAQPSAEADQLEAAVGQLSQRLESLNTQLAQQASFCNAEIAALRTRTANLDTTVTFHAWNSARYVQATAGGTIILNYTTTNVGNGFDTLTGVFTAPVSGIYDLQASVMSARTGRNQHSHVGMFVNDNQVALAISDTDHGFWNQATMKAITHVNAGQRVFLKNTELVARDYMEPYTTFSGFLIKAT